MVWAPWRRNSGGQTLAWRRAWRKAGVENRPAEAAASFRWRRPESVTVGAGGPGITAAPPRTCLPIPANLIMRKRENWSGRGDSNPRLQLGKLSYYPYTTAAFIPYFFYS